MFVALVWCERFYVDFTMKAKSILLTTLFFVSICHLVSAQDATKKVTKNAPAAVLNHIAVYVSDLQRSGDFYGQLFNLPKMNEPFKDGKHIWFSLGKAGQMHLIQGDKTASVYDKNEHLCFSVPSIDAFIAKLNERNINYENWIGDAKAPTVRVDGVKQIYFRDPDGHWLEVNDQQQTRK